MMPDYRADNPYQALLAAHLERLGVSVQFPRGYRRVLPITRAILGCTPRPSVLHLHWPSAYCKGGSLPVGLVYRLKLLLDLCIARMAGVRIVWTVHNLMPHETSFPRLDRWLRRRLARLAHARIVHSAAARREVAGFLGLPPEAFAVIPHGHYRDCYPAPPSRAEARRQLDIPADARVFLHFGMLRPYKGVERLLEVWPECTGEAILVVAGDPIDDAMRAALERLGKHPRVRLHLRHLADDEVSVYFAAADVAVFPFERSLTSGSVALALSFGVPVVGPRLASIQELVGEEGGWLYAASDSEGLPTTLGQAETADVSQAARRARQAAERLDWHGIAIKTRGEYFLADPRPPA